MYALGLFSRKRSHYVDYGVYMYNNSNTKIY